MPDPYPPSVRVLGQSEDSDVAAAIDDRGLDAGKSQDGECLLGQPSP